MLAWTRVKVTRVEKESHSGYTVEGGLIVFTNELNVGCEGSENVFLLYPNSTRDTQPDRGCMGTPVRNFLNCSVGKQESNLPQVIQQVHDRAQTTIQVSCLPVGSLSLSCHSRLVS